MHFFYAFTYSYSKKSQSFEINYFKFKYFILQNLNLLNFRKIVYKKL